MRIHNQKWTAKLGRIKGNFKGRLSTGNRNYLLYLIEVCNFLENEIMGLIKEPLSVDFYFDNRQMTDEDQKRVSS